MGTSPVRTSPNNNKMFRGRTTFGLRRMAPSVAVILGQVPRLSMQLEQAKKVAGEAAVRHDARFFYSSGPSPPAVAPLVRVSVGDLPHQAGLPNMFPPPLSDEALAAMQEATQAHGFRSCCWTTRTEANAVGVEILPGAIGVNAFVVGTGFGKIVCQNIDSIKKPSDIKSFLAQHPLPKRCKNLPGEIIRPRCFYWKEEWKDCWSSERLPQLVALQAAQKKYKLRRELWICAAELEAHSIALRRNHATTRGVPLVDGVVLTLYNAEQTSNPALIENPPAAC